MARWVAPAEKCCQKCLTGRGGVRDRMTRGYLMPSNAGRRHLCLLPAQPSRASLDWTAEGGCPYVSSVGLRGFARALGLEVLLAAYVDFDLFGFGFGFLG